MALLLPEFDEATFFDEATEVDESSEVDEPDISETMLGSITISGIQVYIIHRNDGNNTTYTYITINLDQRIPIGLITYIPGYNKPFIYFDQLDGPLVFPHFCKNMYDQSLNWVDINIGDYNEVIFLRDLFENAKIEAHRFLNRIIIEAQDREYETQFPLDL
jgi:hypothetical protein